MKILRHATIRINFHALLLRGKKKETEERVGNIYPDHGKCGPSKTSISRGGILRCNARLVWKSERCSANEDQLEDWI